MAKKALLIGINYPGTQSELNGCVNDVSRMYQCLVERYGFAEEDITLLIDTDESYTQPNGQNIRAALDNLVSSAVPGDFLFVHYSGHGTRLPAETGEDDDTGYDECIVPCDMNLITDDDFKDLVDKVPEGCQITIVSDSCHSGGLIDDAKEQIGESFIDNRDEDAIEDEGEKEADGVQGVDKSLPLSTLLEILQQKTGNDDVDVGKLRTTLFDLFGEDSTPKFKKFMNLLFSEEDVGSKQEVYAGANKRGLPGGGILISGCQTDQTSADASPSGDPSQAYGALSNAIMTIITESDGQVSNRELVQKARKLLNRQGYTQRPGLYCSDYHADATFLC